MRDGGGGATVIDDMFCLRLGNRRRLGWRVWMPEVDALQSKQTRLAYCSDKEAIAQDKARQLLKRP